MKLKIHTVGRNLREIPRFCFLESVLKARCSLKADQIASSSRTTAIPTNPAPPVATTDRPCQKPPVGSRIALKVSS